MNILANRLRTVLIGSLALVTTGSLRAELPWTQPSHKRRRLVQVTEAPQAGYAAFTFASGGHILRNGEDVIVTTEQGVKLPHQVIWSEPLRSTTVAFPAKKGPERFIVYYDSSIPAPASTMWKENFSLLLETREAPPGTAPDWNEMRKLLNRRSKVYGRGFVPNIWHGENPFGPDDNYMSVYTGNVLIPEDGTYGFATISDDASFLLVDDRMIAEWPGTHGMWQGARGEHSGRVKLSAGIHEIRYCHVEDKSEQGMVAAWKKPGAEQFEIIPESAFIHPGATEELAHERYRSTLAARFRTEQVSGMLRDGKQVTLVHFENSTHTSAEENAAWHWDFGDGSTSSEKSPDHVFLTEEPLSVTLTARAGDAEDTFSMAAIINTVSENISIGRDGLQRYAMAIAGTTFATVARTDLDALLELVGEAPDRHPLLPVLEQLMQDASRGGATPPPSLLKLLAEGYEESEPEKAAKLYKRLMDLEQGKEDGTRAAISLGELLMAGLRKPGEARAVLRRAVDGAPRGSSLSRMAQIRLADVLGYEGKYEERDKAYRKIQGESMAKPEPAKEGAVRQGARARTIEAYLEEGRFREARDEAERWELAYPTARSTAEFTMFNARAIMATGRAWYAKAELELFKEANPISPSLSNISALIEDAARLMTPANSG